MSFSIEDKAEKKVKFLQPFVLTTQPLSTTQRRSQSMRSNRTFAGCFNRSPCCEQCSRKGACRRNRNYMRQFCRAACGICRPTYNINDGK